MITFKVRGWVLIATLLGGAMIGYAVRELRCDCDKVEP